MINDMKKKSMRHFDKDMIDEYGLMDITCGYIIYGFNCEIGSFDVDVEMENG